ncbi:MAG: hypothetical protein GWN33_17540 [Gammaproteobacteria bacterium]|nr:hypothetical protein [Gammaproteobacteria bacterium]
MTALNISAETLVSKACSSQADVLLSSLVSEELPEMTAAQASRVHTLSKQACEREFMQKQPDTAQETEKEVDEKSSGDLFTDLILRSEPSDKAGNKRLKRKLHR